MSSSPVTLPELPSIGDSAAQAAKDALNLLPNMSSALGGTGLLSKINVASATAIILGLILIAAGVFAFKEVHQTVVQAAKVAAVA